MKGRIFLLTAALTAACVLSACGKQTEKAPKLEKPPEDFSFMLVWGCRDDHSYDSATGKLVKDKYASHPEDFVAEYHLTEQERDQMWRLLRELNVNSYPDEYDVQNGKSKPGMTLILTVRTAEGTKTIRTKGAAYSYESKDPKAQKFLTACRTIEELIFSTKVWQDLPEYETLYS